MVKILLILFSLLLVWCSVAENEIEVVGDDMTSVVDSNISTTEKTQEPAIEEGKETSMVTIEYEFPTGEVKLNQLLPTSISSVELTMREIHESITIEFLSKDEIDSFLSSIGQETIYSEFTQSFGAGGMVSELKITDGNGLVYVFEDTESNLNVRIGNLTQEYSSAKSENDVHLILFEEVKERYANYFYELSDNVYLLPYKIENELISLTSELNEEIVFNTLDTIKDFDFATEGFTLYENNIQIEKFDDTVGIHHVFLHKGSDVYQLLYEVR